MASNAQLFSSNDQSASYADFRPVYPPNLFTAIWDYARLTDHDVALDIATGTGQAIPPLAAKFRRVIGLDGSDSQVKSALQLPNVEYIVADAHATGLPEHSVDLVTTAQALHWFELPAYYKEVRRVLRPHGCLAVWTYDMGCINSPTAPVNLVLQKFYNSMPWSPRRKLVDLQYAGMDPTKADFEETTRQEFTMDTRVQIEPHVMGYVRSWSSVETFLKNNPGQDPLPQLKADLIAALAATAAADGGAAGQPAVPVDEHSEVSVVRTLTLILSRGPLPSSS